MQSIETQDIPENYSELVKENLNENGTAHVVYCRDFLGNLFELVEDIKQ